MWDDVRFPIRDNFKINDQWFPGPTDLIPTYINNGACKKKRSKRGRLAIS